MSDCYRDSDINYFYNVNIVKTTSAISPVSVKAFSYTEFSPDFLNYYSSAVMPVDYQAVMVFTPVVKQRSLTDEATRILIIANDNYGTKQAVPLAYNQNSILKKSTSLPIAVSSNIEAKVEFILQFLNGSYFSIESNQNSINLTETMTIKSASERDSGFLAVITSDIGSIFEDPINYYNIPTVDASGRLLQSRHFENRFFATVVTEGSNPV